MGIHPLRGKNNIDKAYRDYLATTFPVNDSVIEEAFLQELNAKNLLSKGPFLEVTSPYQKGKSIEQLIDEGLLSKHFYSLNQEDLPAGRPLYLHQEKSIVKAAQKKNFVVATGTGSGKTESFMLPILNDLFQELESHTLQPGVRALFVYPMNALANDQMKRLRSLLKQTPNITFGRYTGETEHTKREAEAQFAQQNPGEKILPNELLSRQEMREAPPHILVTNYAMLEYLLLRPTDTAFFDGPYSNQWKFIVLDEAHTYNGANGIEVGMLLRRLKDRVLKKRPFNGSLQCIATSATLGKGPDVKQKVLKFAENIFDEPFDYTDAGSNDLIESERIDYRKEHVIKHRLDWKAYQLLLELVEKEFITESEIRKLAEYGISDVTYWLGINRNIMPFLYELLSGDENLFALRDLLQEKPKELEQVLSQLIALQAKYGEVKRDEIRQGVIDLVNLAVQITAEDSQEPLLPARYHVFVRAIEGCYLRLHPSVKVSLQAKKKDEKTNHPVFEMGVCSNCGQVHLIGDIVDDQLVQRQPFSQQSEVNFYTAFMIKGKSETAMDEDEEEEVDLKEADKETYELCSCCSAIFHKSEDSSFCCDERNNKKIPLITLVKEEMKRAGFSKCNHCGKKTHNPIKLFQTGNDGPAAVLATALYQQLVHDSKKTITQGEVLEKDDLFGDLFMDTSSETTVEEQFEPQKLLVFSDSRQEAAFFAPYLDYVYERDLWRSILYKTLDKYDHAEPIGLRTWAADGYSEAQKWNVFEAGTDQEERKGIAEEYVMAELIKGNVRNSLEGTGLISFEIDLPEKIQLNLARVVHTVGFQSAEDFKAALQVILNTLRSKNATTHLERSKFDSERMSPVNYQYAVNKEVTDQKAYVLAWLPKKTNARFDYLKRVFMKEGLSETAANEKARNTLDIIWKLLNTFYSHFFQSKNGNSLLNHLIWRIKTNQPLYQCSHCKTITANNIHEVCVTNGCHGTLEPIQKNQIKSHYINRYKQNIPVKMTTKEHTAQLSPKMASSFQEKFVKGEINVLSCSTTFEMGVDVGGLEAVFLRNVPPETANYIQRAGRAGRRKASVAFVLTFAQRRSHDLTYYQEPENIIAGMIKPPVLKMDNPKIIKRHLNSLMLAAFFKENAELFGKVGDFFLNSAINQSGPIKLDQFMNSVSKPLQESVRKITSFDEHLLNHPEMADWEEDLKQTDTSLMKKISKRYYNDLKELMKVREEDFKKGKSTDKLNRVMNRVQSEGLISFLSTANIIPKYGFPVDVVEMKIPESENNNLRLSRDLSIAIAEYAPGSQIVANGVIYESTGIQKIKGFEVPTLFYTECRKCKTYKVIERLNPNFRQQTAICEDCGETNVIHKMIIPKFGFTARRVEKAGEKKPGRENRSRVFFSEYFYSEEPEIREHQYSVEKEKEIDLKSKPLKVKYSPFGKLSVVSKARGGKGYMICSSCGSMVFEKGNKHKNMLNRKCDGMPEKRAVHLGHEFISDVLELEFSNVIGEPALWESTLYALLNGISIHLGINRRDIDGCILYRHQATPSIILFDKVPGGAGYMNAVYEQLESILKAGLKVVTNCQCGKETSCYGCLKDYSNQYCHDQLARGKVEGFLQEYV